MPETISAKEFGRLQAEVENLKTAVEKMSGQVDAILELANRSKGGFWVGMGVVSFLSGAVTLIAERFFK